MLRHFLGDNVRIAYMRKPNDNPFKNAYKSHTKVVA